MNTLEASASSLCVSALFSSVRLETEVLDLPNGNVFVLFFAKCASRREIEIKIDCEGALSTLGLHQ